MKCILIVDSFRETMEITKELLTYFDYQVIGETDPFEALKIFSAQPEKFNLVITEQNMPGLSGVELAKKLRQINPYIPILFYSGSIDNEVLEKIKNLGHQRFILKPFSLKQLLSAIRELLKESEVMEMNT